MKGIFVKKRDGSKEVFDPDKIHKILFWATEDLSGVSVSHLEMKAHLQLYQNITTEEIHEILIAAAHELISEESPNYQWVASRLRLFQLRKEALGQYEPWKLHDLIVRNIGLKIYTEELLQWYTQEEWNELDKAIDHTRDFNYAFAGMEQFHGKYLVQDRTTKQVFETPQYLNMLVSATLFHKYPAETRLSYVKDFYDYMSKGIISLPTPIMAGMRTPIKQFSSCVLIECGDSLDSINATTSAIVKYISQKAGIGIEGGHIRALNSRIRGGDTRHTGVTPFYRLFQSAVKSCSQGGVRGGAATLYFPYWHLEVETILNLKNNKGTDENSVRHIDYGIQTNKLLFERLIQGKDITLFNPSDVTDMHEAFFSNQEEFARLYEKYEKDPKIPKKTMSAMELFVEFHTERKETGRIYKINVDHANEYGSFDPVTAPIRMSNLCAEITLPTVPLEDINDEKGEIALCTLAAYNLGKLKRKEDMEKPLELLVRGLNELLDYQLYPVKAAKTSTDKYRPLGVGLIGVAHWLAKNDFKYSDDSGLEAWEEVMEAYQYYLIKASMELARERGTKIAGWENTKYSKGLMPVDRYKKDLDNLVAHNPKMDWDSLREQVLEHGMMNATLSAGMPSETSSQVSNATNGFEPPRGYISIKGSGEGRLKQVVPGFPRLKNKYELLWDQPHCRGYLNICAIAQKYFDQSISTNTFYNPQNYQDENVPMSELIQDDIYAYKHGIKTLYYCNSFDGQSDEVDDDCGSGACKI